MNTEEALVRLDENWQKSQSENKNKQNLPLPLTNVPEIHVVGGQRYLVAKVPETLLTVEQMLNCLRRGDMVLCPVSRRGQLTTELKKATIYTKQKKLNNEWLMFRPCNKRPFKN